MKSPYQVQHVFNADMGTMVWSLTRCDGGLLDSDGGLAYNFYSEASAIRSLNEMSHKFYLANADK